MKQSIADQCQPLQPFASVETQADGIAPPSVRHDTLRGWPVAAVALNRDPAIVASEAMTGKVNLNESVETLTLQILAQT
ncbi:MAG: hypothetical protein F9B45_08395 [Phycisphaera sp. RhM]|nr:hypothetical protein [Phycisphaera sp. RhM]